MWDAKKAEKFFRALANGYIREARHIRQCIGPDGVHSNEEEAYLFLTQGLGWDEEEADAQCKELGGDGETQRAL